MRDGRKIPRHQICMDWIYFMSSKIRSFTSYSCSSGWTEPPYCGCSRHDVCRRKRSVSARSPPPGQPRSRGSWESFSSVSVPPCFHVRVLPGWLWTRHDDTAILGCRPHRSTGRADLARASLRASRTANHSNRLTFKLEIPLTVADNQINSGHRDHLSMRIALDVSLCNQIKKRNRPNPSLGPELTPKLPVLVEGAQTRPDSKSFGIRVPPTK